MWTSWNKQRPNIWFFFAWTLLTAVVAFGFLIQASTIRLLHDTQDRQEDLIEFIQVEAARQVMAVCDISLTLHPNEEPEVRKLFEKYHIDCP